MGIFSKTTDYNLILEKILEGKSFSEVTKSILLSMLYKIETSYDDYAKVKNISVTKSQFISDILRIISEYVEIVKNVEPASDESAILQKNKVLAITNEKERTILSYPTESAMLYAVSDIDPKYFYISGNFVFKKEFQKMLVEGCNLNTLEILENFNGWSWNPKLRIDKGYISNLIYQNLIIMFGFDFIQMCKTSSTKEYDIVNYIKNFNKQYYNKLIEIIYLSNKSSKLDLEIKSKIITLKKKIKASENIESLQEKKKILLKKIEKIDIIVKSNELLKKNLILRNSKLKEEDRIKDVKELFKILNFEKKEFLEKINNITELEDKKIVKQCKEKLELYESLILLDKNLEEIILELQIIFIKILFQKSKEIKTREDFIDIIFKIRYYANIYVNKESSVKTYPELEKLLNKILKNIITLGTKNGFFKMISYNVNLNYEIIRKCLDSNCIDLDKLKFKLNICGKTIIVEVFDNEIFEKSFEISFSVENPELVVKNNKKNKIFI